MTIDVRPVGTDDQAWNRLASVNSASFYEDPPERVPEHDGGVMELDRAVVAYDGDDGVGSAAAYSLNLSVPGGFLPTAGVTWVGVLPTHRRRGVMTALLRKVHDSVHDAGQEPLLALWASQGAIYQRFGYGVAAHSYLVHVPHTLTLAHASESSAQVEYLTPTDDRTRTTAIYRAASEQRPGMPEVTPAWHERNVADPKDQRGGKSSLRTYIASENGEDAGYARVRFQHDWSTGSSNGIVHIEEMVYRSSAAANALYRMLLSAELMSSTRIWNLALDDPLLTWLDEPKRLDLHRRDQLYLRLTSVETLTMRAYTRPFDVVIEVVDAFHPWNDGVWQLSSTGAQTQCSRTTKAPDVSVDVSVLAATFLGSTRWGTLALAGQVTEHTPGSVALLDTAFSWPLAAFCPFVF